MMIIIIALFRQQSIEKKAKEAMWFKGAHGQKHQQKTTRQGGKIMAKPLQKIARRVQVLSYQDEL